MTAPARFVGLVGRAADAERAAAAVGGGRRLATGGWLALAADGGRAGAGCLLDGAVDSLDELAAAAGIEQPLAPEALLARAFARLGEGIAAHLRGSFAVVLWDEDQRRVLLVRDPMGERGLVWARTPGGIAFASEVAELVAVLPARPAPDEAAVAHWLAVGWMPADRTLYAGVRRVEPGHALAVDATGAVRSWRYWQPVYVRPAPIGAAEAAERVAATLGRVLRRQAGAGGETAIMLSGGLDSGAVAALAAAVPGEGRPRRAYSAVFPEHPSVDESALIALVAGSTGLRSVRAVVRAGSVLAAAVPYLERWVLPPVSPNLFFWAPLLRRAAADGTTLLLDGQGGDELFNLSGYLLADRLREGRPLAALRLMARVPGAHGRPPRDAVIAWMRHYGLRGALPAALHERARRARGEERHAPGFLRPRTLRALIASDDPHGWKRLDGPRWWAHLVANSSRGIGPQLAFDHLRRRDAMAGLCARHPLADPELVELVLSFPPELAFHPDHNRPLLREAVRGLLPDPVRLRRDKSTFDAVFHEGLATRDLPALRALLGAPDAEVAAFADPPALEREVLQGPPADPAGRQAWALHAWRLATAELWLRAQADPAAPARLLAAAGLAGAASERVTVEG